MELKNFFPGEEIELEDLGNGMKRKVTAFHDNLMCVEVHFEKGAIGALHSHPHEQITYILSGEFEFNIGGTKKVLKAGDSTFKQPHIEHGALCLKEGVLLDIFTPCRKDFLN
ncbi:cupin domain-containing protein [Spirochaeta isovalerica]|uniref:Quercetin dioxygenase-like cupin family protein n=1 Tax=Spirochaeta isovalerica TaxID=150 RepID=A0A841RB34_9SPIO|nr:cupin domain-containing protein [Spirochaeta isovalerica]MBB6479888.1 quercetin dioxygenase-like cupin family protein [Spirochaeta isovalerica]